MYPQWDGFAKREKHWKFQSGSRAFQPRIPHGDDRSRKRYANARTVGRRPQGDKAPPPTAIPKPPDPPRRGSAADELNDRADPAFSGSARYRRGQVEEPVFIRAHASSATAQKKARQPQLLVQRYIVRCQRLVSVIIPDLNNHFDVRHFANACDIVGSGIEERALCQLARQYDFAAPEIDHLAIDGARIKGNRYVDGLVGFIVHVNNVARVSPFVALLRHDVNRPHVVVNNGDGSEGGIVGHSAVGRSSVISLVAKDALHARGIFFDLRCLFCADLLEGHLLAINGNRKLFAIQFARYGTAFDGQREFGTALCFPSARYFLAHHIKNSSFVFVEVEYDAHAERLYDRNVVFGCACYVRHLPASLEVRRSVFLRAAAAGKRKAQSDYERQRGDR